MNLLHKVSLLLHPEAAEAIKQRDRQREASRVCNAKRRKELKADGVCPDCRKRPAEQGSVTCGPCRERNRVKSGEYRAERPRDVVVERERDRARRDRVKADGLCSFCRRAPREDGYSSCSPCRATRAAYARSRRKADMAPAP